MNELGEVLRQLRGKNSLRTISERTGKKISFGYLGLLEKGINPETGEPVKPTYKTLQILSDVYNYSYEHFLYLAGYLENFEIHSSNTIPIIENKIEKLYTQYIALSQGEKMQFINMIMK